MNIKIYQLILNDEVLSEAVCEEPCTTIQLSGGYGVHFEAESYHVCSWVREYNQLNRTKYQVKRIEFDIDVSTKSMSNWKEEIFS